MRVTELSTGDTRSMYVPVIELDELEGVARPERDDTVNTASLKDFDVDDLLQPLKDVGERIKDTLSPLRPSSVEVEVSLAVGIKSGRLVSVLVDGKADTGIKITLGWDLSGHKDPS